MQVSDEQARLELRGIRKAYPSVVANDGIDLDVRPGQIHAVLGENGAGKSTLMKIINGVVIPDAGEILWEGRHTAIASPAHARQLGIGMVFQHFSLFETLTVAENVALGLRASDDLAAVSRQIVDIADRYGVPIEPRRVVHSLSAGERQRVEIIRCLLLNPKLLILDEPTSVLTPQAAENLFETLRQLAGEGRSILYISHKLHEVRALCDVVTVLRAGRVTGRCAVAGQTDASLARMMFGREPPAPSHPSGHAFGDVLLEVRHLSLTSAEPFGRDLTEVGFALRGGEIVGIAGISGNGQQELLACLSGEQPVREASRVRLCGVDAGRLTASARRRLGLCFVPEERLGRGAVPDLPLAENALLTAGTRPLVSGGMIRRGQLEKFATRCVGSFGVACSGLGAKAKSLSGGNLQKFIVGREVLQQPKVLVVAQPTWGLDVVATAFVRQLLVQQRHAGVAVLVVSEDLDELFEICDRIAVIAGGRLSAPTPAAELSVEQVGVLMSGGWSGMEDAASSAAPGEVHHAIEA